MPLEHKRTFCRGEMTARFEHPFRGDQTVVLCIPGGPGLGSSYLDPFLAELASRASVNAGVLDLPNHGASVVPSSRLPLSYVDSVDYVRKAVTELSAHCKSLFLFGQSFGARVVFDILWKLPHLRGAILTGFPYVFQMSTGMIDRLGNLDLEPLDGTDPEGAFARNWSKIFPLYSPRPVPLDTARALASGTHWLGNEKMLDEVPAIEPIAERLRALRIAPPMLILEGSVDGVVPDGNLEHLKTLVPQARFRLIDGGHFLMAEEPERVLAEFVAFLSNFGAGV